MTASPVYLDHNGTTPVAPEVAVGGRTVSQSTEVAGCGNDGKRGAAGMATGNWPVGGSALDPAITPLRGAAIVAMPMVPTMATCEARMPLRAATPSARAAPGSRSPDVLRVAAGFAVLALPDRPDEVCRSRISRRLGRTGMPPVLALSANTSGSIPAPGTGAAVGSTW